MKMHTLVVDGDPRVRNGVGSTLGRDGIGVTLVADGREALTAFDAHPPDLLILAVGMPDMDGVELSRALRGKSGVPILFLPARDQEIARLLREDIAGFDYAAKPLSPPELLARVHALRDHMPGCADSYPATLRHGPLAVCPGSRSASWNGRQVALDGTELLTLEMMVRQPGRLFSRESIMVVSFGGETNPVLIDRHVEGICRKFQAAGCPELINIVCGVGFTLVRSG